MGTDVTGPLAHSAAVLLTIAKFGYLDLRQRDRDEFTASFANHLAMRDVFRKSDLIFPRTIWRNRF